MGTKQTEIWVRICEWFPLTHFCMASRTIVKDLCFHRIWGTDGKHTVIWGPKTEMSEYYVIPHKL